MQGGTTGREAFAAVRTIGDDLTFCLTDPGSGVPVSQGRVAHGRASTGPAALGRFFFKFHFLDPKIHLRGNLSDRLPNFGLISGRAGIVDRNLLPFPRNGLRQAHFCHYFINGSQFDITILLEYLMAVDAGNHHFIDSKSRKRFEGSSKNFLKPVFIAKIAAWFTTTIENNSDSRNLFL